MKNNKNMDRKYSLRDCGLFCSCYCFFFQAEDGIRDGTVTGVQTCALPISSLREALKINRTLCSILVQRGIDTYEKARQYFRPQLSGLHDPWLMKDMDRSEERRVGKECRSR